MESVPQLHHACHCTVWVVRDSLDQAVQLSVEARPARRGCPGFIPPLGYGEETLSRCSKNDVFCSVLWSFCRLAFCTWLISILFFSMSILLYGGHMLLLTATLILFSLLFFFTVRDTLKCPIQFGSVSLKTDYGESFWLTLATGECSACFWGFSSPSLQR